LNGGSNQFLSPLINNFNQGFISNPLNTNQATPLINNPLQQPNLLNNVNLKPPLIPSFNQNFNGMNTFDPFKNVPLQSNPNIIR
jgi:hypothetical protein